MIDSILLMIFGFKYYRRYIHTFECVLNQETGIIVLSKQYLKFNFACQYGALATKANNNNRKISSLYYEGGSICNENPFITPSTNALGFNAICQTKDQSGAVIMVHETLFYLFKFNKLLTF